MKIYLKGYDKSDTLSTDFPMNVFHIQDTLDRMGGSTEVRFTISQFENMNLPHELCQKEFTANIYALNLFADRLEKMDSAENAAFISVLKSHPESSFDEMLEMTFGLDSEPVLPKLSFHDMHQIGALNELAEELSRLSRRDFVKLKAVMEAENITEISDTIDCIKRLPEYDFHRNICDESDFGREYLMRNLPTDFRISALDGVDFFDFGLKITQLSGSAVTPYGAVSGRGQQLYSALTVQPAEEECETEELKIGGMSL